MTRKEQGVALPSKFLFPTAPDQEVERQYPQTINSRATGAYAKPKANFRNHPFRYWSRTDDELEMFCSIL